MKNSTGLVYTALFAVLTGVGALIIIPAPFVPVTLQSLFCLLSGALLGKKMGPTSQGMYILLGLAGMPVFSRGGSGPGVLLGPTGGYIIGFIPASYITGFFTQKKHLIAGLILGTLVIYATGLLQLKFITQRSWPEVFLIGAAPFIPGDILKIIAAAGVYNYLDRAGIGILK